ncbi:MAG: hypothetical protein ACI33P_02420 [Lysinibacillus sp.]
MDKERKKLFEELPDRPDMVDTDKISIYDLHEDMQTVDVIPMDELNQKVIVESSNEHLNRVPGMTNLERNEQQGKE